jgi:hypothetical protein
MEKQPSRLQIWDLSGQKTPAAKENTPSVEGKQPFGGASELRGDRLQSLGRFAGGHRGELFFADFAPFSKKGTEYDEAMFTSLYDHRLPIDVELPGRCTMPNGRSTTCKTRRISSESVDLVYDLKTASYPIRHPEDMPAGSTVHLDVDQIGNFHGVVTAQSADGFQLAVDVDCKGMLIPKLARVAAAIRANSLEEPVSTAKPTVMRIEPTIQACSYIDGFGVPRRGKIINISRIDALIKAPVVPPIASHIIFGGDESYMAEVTRTFEIGFAVRFCTPIPEAAFSSSIKLLDG